MADNQKFFLDLGGLRTLWGKITSTFATKSDVDTKVEAINNSIGEVHYCRLIFFIARHIIILKQAFKTRHHFVCF